MLSVVHKTMYFVEIRKMVLLICFLLYLGMSSFFSISRFFLTTLANKDVEFEYLQLLSLNLLRLMPIQKLRRFLLG